VLECGEEEEKNEGGRKRGNQPGGQKERRSPHVVWNIEIMTPGSHAEINTEKSFPRERIKVDVISRKKSTLAGGKTEQPGKIAHTRS